MAVLSRLANAKSMQQNFTLPPNHQPGMRVPVGGSSCSTCRFLGDDGVSCMNSYFQQWHGSAVLPAPANSYCSDWYEEARTGSD